jgi:hypothetical protein
MADVPFPAPTVIGSVWLDADGVYWQVRYVSRVTAGIEFYDLLCLNGSGFLTSNYQTLCEGQIRRDMNPAPFTQQLTAPPIPPQKIPEVTPPAVTGSWTPEVGKFYKSREAPMNLRYKITRSYKNQKAPDEMLYDFTVYFRCFSDQLWKEHTVSQTTHLPFLIKALDPWPVIELEVK